MQCVIYKKWLVFVLACGTGLLSTAQEKQPYEMLVDGVKVIVKPSNNEIAVIQTIIKGGVQNYPAGKAGIESLAMNALTECGTAKDDKNSFKNKLDKVSAQVYGYTGMDYAVFVMNCIRSDFNVVWPLYTDALETPRFDKKEFDRIRQDAINILKANASFPDYSIQKLGMQTAFAGKDYAKSPEGTEQTVSALTAEGTLAYYKSILVKSRMLIVVVAEIERAELEQKIHAMLENIPAGDVFTLKKEAYSPKQNTFKSEKKELATNYLLALTGGPAAGSPDGDAFNIAMRIFYDRHFLEVRTNNGLSYAPSAGFSRGLTSMTSVGVSTTDPNKYIKVMQSLVNKTKKEGFKAEEVAYDKSIYLSDIYYGQETNDAQASSMVRNEILFNNWRRTYTLADDIKTITAADLNKAFNKYITNLTWVYQGDPSKVDPSLYTGNTQQKLPASKLTNKKNK